MRADGIVNEIAVKMPTTGHNNQNKNGRTDAAEKSKQLDSNIIKLNELQNESYKNDLNEQKDSQEKQAKDEEKTAKAIEKANKKIESMGRRLEFSVHEGTHDVMVKVIDTTNDSVIREIPSEKVLDMVEKMYEIAGLLVDEKR